MYSEGFVFIHRHHGIIKLVVGVLILLNAFVWPKWMGIDGWIAFFGVLLVLGGFLMVLKKSPACCSPAMPALKTAAKRKKK